MRTPVCEVCKTKTAGSFSNVNNDVTKDNAWKFVCVDCEADFTYDIDIESFYGNPVACLAHLNTKSWMNWPNFLEMIDRFNLHQSRMEGKQNV